MEIIFHTFAALFITITNLNHIAMRYIIVGGVAGGATAAARIRRIDEHAEIILIERSSYISYANCGLPYYIGGVIAERERLFLQTPQSFGARFNVDARVEQEVVDIDTSRKQVLIKRGDGSTYSESYDKVLLSPGAVPFVPNVEGIHLEGIFTLRNVADTDRIKEYVTKHSIKRAAVIGAGFIGLEMAENLHHLGANVSIVEMADQVMPPVDFSMASHVHQHLSGKGVNLHLGEQVVKFVRSSDGTITVQTAKGKSIEVDMAILSIGVRPETALAKKVGIKLGETGGIWVDEYLQTSIKDIYAVGDAIEFPHPLTGKPYLNYLANPANRQGRIVADNMVQGNTIKYEGAIGTAIAQVFDMVIATTGLSAKMLKKMGITYATSTTYTNSHAGYYPNSTPLCTKLLYTPDGGKLLGAQVVGYEGVDKRIDQLALAIKNNATVADLTKLEHAYAPPFSSAKDPVAIAGYVAMNVVSGKMPVITWRDLHVANKQELTLIDVRTEEEFACGAVEGSINIPVDSIRKRLNDVPKGKPIVVICAIGLRGYLSQQILLANGFKDVRNLTGGYKTYSMATQPVNNKEFTSTTQICSAEPNCTVVTSSKMVKVDASGLQCPGPILKLKQAVDGLSNGDMVEITSSDAGFARDVVAWCESTGNRLVSNIAGGGSFTAVVEKGNTQATHAPQRQPQPQQGGLGKTLIMFSDDFDRAIATFILANGAAATGTKTTIFFTFWGLNLIKKEHPPKVSKDFWGKMFSMMMAKNSKRTKLSKLNMMGIGTKLMRYIMKKNGVSSLEELRSQALEQGVEFIACQMSMDLMGVKKDELIDGVTVGGVATYMGRAEKANVNLFI